MNNLYERTIFSELKKYLYDEGILVLHGARQVGKTSILFYLENYLKARKETVKYIDLEDSRYVESFDRGYQELIKYLDSEGLDTRKKIFVLIDEIQYLSNPSSFLKLLADHHKNIKLIVSGSSSFDIKSKFKNSLVGRTINFEIYPLSFEEFLKFKKYPVALHTQLSEIKQQELIKLFQEYALFGGYPKIVLTAEVSKKEKLLQQIIDTYIRKDIRDLATIKDLDKFNQLLKVLAAQSGNLLNILELSNTTGLAKQTIEKYLFLLENTFILKLVYPHSSNLRSELFKSPKVYFYDTGLMQLLWLRELPKELLGSVFETCIFTELSKKYGPKNIFFWRTKDKKEIDFILKTKSSILPIEAKINFEQFNSSAIRFFTEKYRLKNYRVIGLRGKRKNQHYSYPWEI